MSCRSLSCASRQVIQLPGPPAGWVLASRPASGNRVGTATWTGNAQPGGVPVVTHYRPRGRGLIGVLASSASTFPLSGHGRLPLDNRAVATTTVRIEDYDLPHSRLSQRRGLLFQPLKSPRKIFANCQASQILSLLMGHLQPTRSTRAAGAIQHQLNPLIRFADAGD